MMRGHSLGKMHQPEPVECGNDSGHRQRQLDAQQGIDRSFMAKAGTREHQRNCKGQFNPLDDQPMKPKVPLRALQNKASTVPVLPGRDDDPPSGQQEVQGQQGQDAAATRRVSRQ